MGNLRQFLYYVIFGSILISISNSSMAQASQLQNLQKMPEAISGVASPKFEKPSWYQKQIEAEKAKTRVINTSKPTSSVVT